MRLGGAAGWGTVGALAAGPFGLAAGLILGGRGKKIVFAVKFKDGKKALIEVDQKKEIVAAQFQAQSTFKTHPMSDTGLLIIQALVLAVAIYIAYLVITW